jgi:LysM domain
MKTAWFKLAFGLTVFVLLVSFGFAQTETAQGTPSGDANATAAEAAPAPAPAKATGELPEPLQSEMTVAKHWSKNPYPQTIPAGARVHIVERGDTLWDLARHYYNNPFLWPQIWEANNYIPNAHWIYPGDPIIIPPLSPVTEEKIAQETASEPVTGGPGSAEPGPGEGGATGGGGGAKAMYPIALDTDLYCSGYITPSVSNIGLWIMGTEDHDKIGQELFDIVYLNKGEADGISPGDEFTVLHTGHAVRYTVDFSGYGQYVVQAGRIKVVATQEHTSTAQITYGCDAIYIGNLLVPFEPKEVPVFTDMPPIDRFSPEGQNTKGHILYTKDDLGSVGLNNEVQIDLGSKDGIHPGTRLVIYRYQNQTYEEGHFSEPLPRRVLGELVVFNVQDATATGRVIQSFDYIEDGDRVEVR